MDGREKSVAVPDAVEVLGGVGILLCGCSPADDADPTQVQQRDAGGLDTVTCTVTTEKMLHTTLYFIHPSRKLKLLFDLIVKHNQREKQSMQSEKERRRERQKQKMRG